MNGESGFILIDIGDCFDFLLLILNPALNIILSFPWDYELKLIGIISHDLEAVLSIAVEAKVKGGARNYKEGENI